MKKKKLELISPLREDAFTGPVLHKVVLSQIDFYLPDEIWLVINEGFGIYWEEMIGFGNYIDFGAMNEVDEDTFLGLFDRVDMQERDVPVYRSFLNACEKASEFLLITDNCGEIVLDKLMIRQLKNRFPKLHVTLLMRGKDVLNDATPADAVYFGLDALADIVDNGLAIAGTIPSMLPEPAFKALEKADVILAKGQGNYESLSRQGYHVFYAFLCKCELFMNRFQVPKLTGIFVEETGDQ